MGRLIAAVIAALFALGSYFFSTSENPVTGETQRVAMSPEQEVAVGQKTAPHMAAQMGGLSQDARAVETVRRLGARLVAAGGLGSSPYKFTFNVLADRKTINAFALPGGPVFITEGLLKVLRTEGEIAAVLGHEIGHVVARHSSERLAKQQLTQGLVGATVLGTGDYTAAQMAQVVGGLVNMKYGRDDEIESDILGIRMLAKAGYDPRAAIGVMDALAKASGPNRQPEMLSTHPNPENRAERIRAEIAKAFPGGVPAGLKR